MQLSSPLDWICNNYVFYTDSILTYTHIICPPIVDLPASVKGIMLCKILTFFSKIIKLIAFNKENRKLY